MTPRFGLSLMPEGDYRAAVAPLLEGGEVEVLEWTLDNGWAQRIPDWAAPLLRDFGERGRLYGHGFSFSPLSGGWTERHAVWLKLLGMEVERRRYQHCSEHFCFVTAGDFQHSAPMPVPLNGRSLALGKARMERLAETAGMRVGLENLAIALGPRDVRAQGQFLGELLEHVDGFLLLDVHNLYCQLHNFALDADELLASYPLHRVTELHLSGGSWDESEGQPFRRDTHDEAVPEEVFALLERVLKRCPTVEAVFFERLGGTIAGEADASQLRRDYRRAAGIVAEAGQPLVPLDHVEPPTTRGELPLHDEVLAHFQAELLDRLERAVPAARLIDELDGCIADPDLRDYVSSLEPRCLSVASRVVRKWALRDSSTARDSGTARSNKKP